MVKKKNSLKRPSRTAIIQGQRYPTICVLGSQLSLSGTPSYALLQGDGHRSATYFAEKTDSGKRDCWMNRQERNMRMPQSRPSPHRGYRGSEHQNPFGLRSAPASPPCETGYGFGHVLWSAITVQVTVGDINLGMGIPLLGLLPEALKVRFSSILSARSTGSGIQSGMRRRTG